MIGYDYNSSADPATFTGYNSGQPDCWQHPELRRATAPHYSMNAEISASSPEICKNGGWEQYGYKNQGQCIASVVANENSGK